MNGSLDEISLAIGSLQADMKSVGRTLDSILAQLKSVQADSARTFDEYAKDIQSLKSFRSRVYGFTGTFSVLMSLLGQYIGRKLS